MKIDIDCVMQDEEGGFVANCNQGFKDRSRMKIDIGCVLPDEEVVHQLSRTRRSSRLGTVHLTTSNSSAHRHYAYLTAPISGPTEKSRVVWAMSGDRKQEGLISSDDLLRFDKD
nr:hypothetical protein Iba_chr13bCG13640 [Ipomoea batatas]